jgi:hypothetical protein
VHPGDAVAGIDQVDAFLVPVPLLLGDQQLGQGPVDAFDQRVRRQPRPEAPSWLGQ